MARFKYSQTIKILMEIAEDIETLIGASMFKLREEKIKETLKAFIEGIEGEEISIEEVRNLMKRIKGTLAQEIIKERDRL